MCSSSGRHKNGKNKKQVCGQKLYRVLFSLAAYVGATTALELVWGFSDIANALMAVPNLICLLALSGVTAREMKNFQHRKRK